MYMAAIRKVIRDELDLKENPPIVVSAVMKDVQGTATKLGLPAEKSYLWDDNEVLKGQPHGMYVYYMVMYACCQCITWLCMHIVSVLHGMYACCQCKCFFLRVAQI